MRWVVALILLTLLAPAGASLKLEHGFPLRTDDAPWAQLACEVVFTAAGQEDCRFAGAVGGANTVRIDVVGTAAAMVFGVKKGTPYDVDIIPTTLCSGSCVVRFARTSGTVDIHAYVSGTTNTLVHAGVGASSDGPGGGRILV